MMAFADGWGWGEWLALALIMVMFFVVVGGAGYMVWRSEEADREPRGDDEPDPTGRAPRG